MHKYITAGLTVSVAYLLYADRLHREINDLHVSVQGQRRNDIRKLRSMIDTHTQALETLAETMGLMKSLLDVRSLLDNARS